MSINIFSVPGLIAWLEEQDPETEYKYTNATDCLIQRYLKSQDVDVPARGYKAHQLDNWGFGNIAMSSPETYGAALARAKEMVHAL